MFVKALQEKNQKLRITCSVNDHIASHAAVSVVFFYPKPISPKTIIHALENVLNDFPLFAGVLIEQQGQLHIDCNNQGVLVKEVYENCSLFQQLSSFDKTTPSTFVELITPSKTVKQQGPLLTIKLSYYTDGMAIGYCWHHAVGDMSSFMVFLKALSAFAKNQSYSSPIIIKDRERYLQEFVRQSKNILTNTPQLKYISWMDTFRFIRAFFSWKKAVYLYFTHNEVESLRSALSEQVGEKLSRNDVLCAHVLNTLAQCRDDDASEHYASIVTNIRPRIGMSLQVLGNYIGAVTIKSTQRDDIYSRARNIHASVKNFKPDNPSQVLDLIQKNGGIKNIKWMLPPLFSPQYKNLIITNWSNFNVYSIDFGVVSPYLFLPTGEAPIPWLSCIVEGFNNTGLLVALVLPSSVAEQLTQPDVLEQIHHYRGQLSPEDEHILLKNPWCV